MQNDQKWFQKYAKMPYSLSWETLKESGGDPENRLDDNKFVDNDDTYKLVSL